MKQEAVGEFKANIAFSGSTCYNLIFFNKSNKISAKLVRTFILRMRVEGFV